jgi:hypothetical protein
MGDFAIDPTMDLAANVADGWFFAPSSPADLVSSLL